MFEQAARDESVRRVALRRSNHPVGSDVAAARAALARLHDDGRHHNAPWNCGRRAPRILGVGPELPVEDRFSGIISRLAAARKQSMPFGFRRSKKKWLARPILAIAPIVVNRSRIGFILQPRYVAGSASMCVPFREFMRENMNLCLRCEGSTRPTSESAHGRRCRRLANVLDMSPTASQRRCSRA